MRHCACSWVVILYLCFPITDPVCHLRLKLVISHKSSWNLLHENLRQICVLHVTQKLIRCLRFLDLERNAALLAIHEARAVDLSTCTTKWVDVFQHIDRNTALQSPLSHPWRPSVNVKTNHSPFSPRDSRKNMSTAEFLEFCFYGCNLRACCNLIKTLNESNALLGIFSTLLAEDVAYTWLWWICLRLKVLFHNHIWELTGKS